MPILFTNPGELDPFAIRTMGVNAKTGDNPIGFFGTGLKYAIAVLLRTNHRIQVWSGTTEIVFGIREHTMRDKSFQVVTMALNGEPPSDLGFTLELGKNWAVWQAYRELWSNATDEGGNVIETRKIPKPGAGNTLIAVTGNEITQVHAESDKFILPIERLRPIHQGSYADYYPGPSTSVFYRGIKVYTLQEPSIFTINLKSGVKLTEDRTMENSWAIPSSVMIDVESSNNADFIEQALTAPGQTLESSLNYNALTAYASEDSTFTKTLRSLDKHPHLNLSSRMYLRLLDQKRLTPETNDLTPVQQQALDRAVTFCKSLGFEVDAYPIIVVDTLGTDVLGSAEAGKIYLSQLCFQQGTKQLAGTLIEEFIHLRHKHGDCTRSMQNFLINALVGLGEELTGQPL